MYSDMQGDNVKCCTQEKCVTRGTKCVRDVPILIYIKEYPFVEGALFYSLLWCNTFQLIVTFKCFREMGHSCK